ncbi:MAG: hypothetical protein LBL47_00890 [Lactobacillus sp.]|jgi:hypothetical protein|nr:hypothetical protein [Lactobacillus sp.]
MNKFIIKITTEDDTLLKDSSIECVILPDSFSKDFYKKASLSEKIILVKGENAIEVCKENNLDGITCDLSKSEQIKKDVADIRSRLGDKILGLITRSRRHEAMLVSEQEPDFVIFKVWKDGIENIEELLGWYNDFFLIQSAALIEDDDININNLRVDIVILKDTQYKKFVAKN